MAFPEGFRTTEDVAREVNSVAGKVLAQDPIKMNVVRSPRRLASVNVEQEKSMVLADVESLCSNNSTMKIIRARLIRLLAQFDISKGYLSPETRRSLREQFLKLAERCGERSDSIQAVSFSMRLANHAYKLAERE